MTHKTQPYDNAICTFFAPSAFCLLAICPSIIDIIESNSPSSSSSSTSSFMRLFTGPDRGALSGVAIEKALGGGGG